MDRQLISIILLGLSFMFVCAPLQTLNTAQKLIVDSIQTEDPDFKGDGYISMALSNVVLSVFGLLAPPAISIIGPKLAIIIGAIANLCTTLSYLWPKTWLYYLSTVITGIGTTLMWTGEGNYFALNSTPTTISRNSGIFWTLMMMNMFIGNLFIFFQFNGLDSIDNWTRTVVIYVLSAIAAVGVIFTTTLPRPKITKSQNAGSAIEVFKSTIRLLFTKDMLLLCFAFFYMGVEISFYSGVYSASIGFTNAFENSIQLVGLSGVFIGVGAITGGTLSGILGPKFTSCGRYPILMTGFVVQLVTYFLILVNLPNSSPFSPTNEAAFINSSPTLAIVCSFLLGFGDALYMTQLISFLGGVFLHDSTSAFAIMKFIQTIGIPVSYAYATSIGLYAQLGILICLAVVGTTAFLYVEWSQKNREGMKIIIL